jgi:signal transduction histidine kinase
MRLYEEAIASAHEHGLVQNEALAHEVAARFYAARGFETFANAYRRNARDCYRRWGGEGKVRQLEQLHPELRDVASAPTATATFGTPVAQLDIGAVVKASHAISGQIVLGQLIETLMTIAVEYAGAERGVLILVRNDVPQIEAEARIDGKNVAVTLRHSEVTPNQLPESLLHTVIRARQTVILDDASVENPFSSDTYIRERHLHSVLCLPLMKQASLIGVLYLENNLASHAFTPARTSVLELLSSQAAISLENARLYDQLLAENRDRNRAEEALRDAQAEISRAARLTTMGELAASIAHEINQPLAAIVSHGSAGMRWLTRETPELGEARDAFAHIVSEGQRAADVIRGLRALSKKSGSQLTALDVDETILEVVALTQTAMERQGVLLTTDLAVGDRRVLGDRVQLQQVLQNLILNAIDAMKTIAGRPRELTISSALTEEGSIMISVGDTGAGLDPAIAPSIFEPFVTTKPDGLGIGLSISRSIVEAHGGRLWVSPRVPHGTLFSFTIPKGVAT